MVCRACFLQQNAFWSVKSFSTVSSSHVTCSVERGAFAVVFVRGLWHSHHRTASDFHDLVGIRNNSKALFQIDYYNYRKQIPNLLLGHIERILCTLKARKGPIGHLSTVGKQTRGVL